MDCSRANIGPTRAHTLAKEFVGSYEDVGATVCDFKNFARNVKVRIRDHDANMLLAKFKLKKETSNNTFYYEYKVDREGHLTGLFWTDAIGQANFEVFGDIVSFDLTFRTNRYKMVFVPFTDVNNHWKIVTFAAGLLAKENYKNFKWLINAMKTAMGRVPSCVITDQCPAIKKALAKHWPSAKHRLCMWHIMTKLPAKISPKLASNKKFMETMKSVVYSEHFSPIEFEEAWTSVVSKYKLEDNDWLTGLFKIRRNWIPAYFNNIEMAGLLRTTSRSESLNFFFQHFHESGDTLVEFYSSFESAMDKQRLHNAADDKRSKQTPQRETTMPIELDASRIYTLEIYYLVREQIKEACFHITIPDMSKDNDSRHFTCKDDLLQGKLFQVSVREPDHHVQCSCKFYFRKGFLCRHAFAALHQCNVQIIPRQFVKPRWTKNAIKDHSTLGSSHEPADTDKCNRTKFKRTRAWFEFHNCIKYAGDDEEKIDRIITGLRSIGSALQKQTDGTHVEEPVHRGERFVGPVPQPETSIQNPLVSRNKGCGTRIKSSKENAMKVKIQRKCSNCGKTQGHNARTCPIGQIKGEQYDDSASDE